MGLDDFNLCVNGTFFSGQSVSGFIKLSCGTELTNIKFLQVKIIGFAHVYWTEKKLKPGRNRNSYNRYYIEKHENQLDLYSSKKILHEGNLSEGQHEIPFEFDLPIDLPCSFEGQYGHVRYYVEAKLERSGIFTPTKRKRQYVTVLSLVDLNKIPKSDQPITISTEKEFSNTCCCIDGGFVTLELNLPRGCFTPGEFIPVTAQIENHSDRTISRTSARFIMDVVYHDHGGNIIKKSQVFLARHQGKIRGGDNYTWPELELCTQSSGSICFSKPKWKEVSHIPPLPPSSIPGFNFCNIIECTYRLEFNVYVRGINRPFISISGPITIGSVPFRAPLTSSNNNAKWGEIDEARSYSPNAPPLRLQDFHDLPPPSYEQATQMEGTAQRIMPRTNDTKDTQANWAFRPMYPIWAPRLVNTSVLS